MGDNALLFAAIREYPKGTKFIPTYRNQNSGKDEESSGEFEWSETDHVIRDKKRKFSVFRNDTKTWAIVTKKAMNKHEQLVEEARKRFPIGTKFYPAHHTGTNEYCVITTDRFQLSNDMKDIYALLEDGQTWERDLRPVSFKFGNTSLYRLVMSNNEWATIIKQERDMELIEKNYTELKYPDVVKINSRAQYDSFANLNLAKGWMGEGYYLCNDLGEIGSRFDKSGDFYKQPSGENYKIYSFSKIKWTLPLGAYIGRWVKWNVSWAEISIGEYTQVKSMTSSGTRMEGIDHLFSSVRFKDGDWTLQPAHFTPPKPKEIIPDLPKVGDYIRMKDTGGNISGGGRNYTSVGEIYKVESLLPADSVGNINAMLVGNYELRLYTPRNNYHTYYEIVIPEYVKCIKSGSSWNAANVVGKIYKVKDYKHSISDMLIEGVLASVAKHRFIIATRDEYYAQNEIEIADVSGSVSQYNAEIKLSCFPAEGAMRKSEHSRKLFEQLRPFISNKEKIVKPKSNLIGKTIVYKGKTCEIIAYDTKDNTVCVLHPEGWVFQRSSYSSLESVKTINEIDERHIGSTVYWTKYSDDAQEKENITNPTTRRSTKDLLGILRKNKV